MYFHNFIRCFAFVICLIAAAVTAQVPESDKARIAAASPEKPIAKPATARKLLVFSRTTGFRHDSIAWGIEAFRVMGTKTGAWSLDATEDPAVFTTDNLKQYDAIVFLNTTGDPVPDPSQRSAIETFVSEGKGLVGIHSATDTGYDWKAYGEMMGGYFAGHPWGAGHVVTIKIEDLNHAINKPAFGGKTTLQHRDEIYQYTPEPYSRDRLRVLLSLDLSKPNMRPGGMKRTDDDYAVGWINTYGKGRIYYNNLGHNRDTFWSKPVLTHFLAGIQFACGDVKADTRPSREVDQELAAKSQARLIRGISTYKIGDDRAAMIEIENAVNRAVGDSQALAKLIESLLKDSKSTHEAKAWALRQLSHVGSKEQVPTIQPWLTDETLSHMARYALNRIEGDEAAAAFRSAINKTTGKVRIGIIGSIARRGDTKAIDAIIELAKGDDDATAVAAIGALGHLGALEVLLSFANQSEPHHRSSVLDALLVAAEKASDEKATKAYTQMMTSDHPTHVRVAALYGAVQSGMPLSQVGDVIAGRDPALRLAAIRIMQHRPGKSVTRQLIASLAEADVDTQLTLVESLASRGDPVAEKAVADLATTTTDGDLRRVCVIALRRLGSSASVTPLAKLAASTSGATRTEVRQTLATLGGDDVDQVMVSLVPQIDADTQPELVRALGDRGRIDDVTKLLSDGKLNSQAREQAFRGIVRSALVLPVTQIATTIEPLLALARNPVEKRLVLAALSRVPDERALAIAEAMRKDKEPAVAEAANKAAEQIGKLLDGPPDASASNNSGAAAAALDGNPATRWDTGAGMSAGMWFMVDLKKARAIKSIVLDTQGSAGDFPRGYEVYISNDPTKFGPSVVTGGPGAAITKIDVGGKVGRFVKIVQTSDDVGLYWSIHEITINTD